MNDRDTDPKDRRSSESKAGKRADQGSGDRDKDKDRPNPDATDYGQPAGSPGGRGGTTCYGGVQRVPPRGGAKDEPPAGR